MLNSSNPAETAVDEKVFAERAINGDGDAFIALYDRHVAQVYRHIHYRVGSQVEAEDLTQETFVKAWKAIGRYKVTEAPFVTWLLTIAHNLVMDHYKSKKRSRVLQEAAQEELVTATREGPEDIIAATLDRERIREAIRYLRGDKQKVILMRFIDDFSHKEIAAALHKTEGAIRVIQCRALDDLKKILGRSMRNR